MIGILIIAHGNLGLSLIECATHVLGTKPEQLLHLEVSAQDDPAAVKAKADDLISQLNSGKGVLVISDMYGATPCNVVCRLVSPGQVEGIAGANLPMLVRALSYRHLALEELVKKAIEGGQSGIINFTKEACQNNGQ